jgi:DNA-binding NarL/FixJ family response regulator
MGQAKIRLLIADDHAVLRAGLRMLIGAQADMEVVGEAADGDEAIRRVLEARPDVALMDITMPGVSGIRAIEEIRREAPETRVLVLTMHDVPAYLRSVLAAGGSGYVVKRSEDAELLSAIRAVPRRTVLDPTWRPGWSRAGWDGGPLPDGPETPPRRRAR